jgi:hypothetical protein
MTSSLLTHRTAVPGTDPPANRAFTPDRPPRTHGTHAEALEREADGVASSFVSPGSRLAPIHGLARRGDLLGKTIDAGNAPREADTDELSGGGNPFDGATRSHFESRFQRDFSAVRIHSGPRADRLATSARASAFTSGNDVAFRQGAYQPGSPAGQALIAHELAHVVQQANGGAPGAVQCAPETFREKASAFVGDVGKSIGEAEDAVGKAWNSAKAKAYQAILTTLRKGKNAAFNELRSHLPEAGTSRAVLSAFIDVADTVVDILIALLVFLVGGLAGFAEGIIDMLVGLVKLVLGIVKFFSLLILGIFDEDKRREFDKFAQEIIDGAKNIPAGLQALVDNWTKKFMAASEAEQYGMIGELTGQIIAFIAGFEVAAAKAGNLPKLTAVIPKLEPALAVAGGGTRAAAATAVTINTGTAVLTGGTLGTGLTILASTGSDQQPQKPRSTEPVETADAPRGFAIEDDRIAEAGYTGLTDAFPTVDAVTGGSGVTVSEGGKAVTVYRDVRAISVKCTRIHDPVKLAQKIDGELGKLADNSTFVGKTNRGVRIDSVASKRYEIVFEQGFGDLPKDTRAILEQSRTNAKAQGIQFQYYLYASDGRLYEGPTYFRQMAKELEGL